jgi:hypothetical protein
MANLQDLGTIANDSSFQNRCVTALEAVAEAVMIESSGTANHTQRVNYAKAVIAGNINAFNVAEQVLTNATIAAEATVASLPGCTSVPDSDIEYAVTSLFNALAGVST